MKIISELTYQDDDRRKTYRNIHFRNEYGNFWFHDQDKKLYKLNDNDVWSSIMGVTSIDEAEKITEEMFGPLEKQEKQKKQVEPMKNLIIHNDSSFSNEELLTIIGIVTKALNEWRLFPDMKEEKEECLHQLEWLKNCRNDENVAAFFSHSGKIFLRIMPEDIRNKVICLIAFKKEAEAA